jgi:alkanesulfonate monooxygenase SsuD/methylene tetrahydromethanopterin reductase-like flavin-dependent oxidoreductase (luciferase family)
MALGILRYELRAPSGSTATRRDRYAACLDQCAYAEQHGLKMAVVTEHHGVDDGWLPSPLLLASAIAGRTESLAIGLNALVVTLHDPLRLAEDIAVLDLVSGGRVSIVTALGYRDEEFEMFGVDRTKRGRILEDHLKVMLQAWTGEPFEYRGRTVQVTPTPFSQPHPTLFVGGSTEASARRAARLHLHFQPSIGDPALGEAYAQACKEEGFTGGICVLPSGPGFVHVTDDPERAWAAIGPYALRDAETYHSWQKPDQRSNVSTAATTVEELDASGVYWVVTPEECLERAKSLGPFGAIVLNPLMGGMDIDLGWESLQLFVDKVLPRL